MERDESDEGGGKTRFERAAEAERRSLERSKSSFAQESPNGFDDELANRCLPKYEDEHHQSVVRTALLILEERVRDMGDFSVDTTGSNLMEEAFNPDGGPLAFGETRDEELGAQFLFTGAIKTLRNPASHRTLEEADEEYARDVLHTVNLLLRFIEINNTEPEKDTLRQVPETGAVPSRDSDTI